MANEIPNSLRDKFSKIYIDQINIYYDGRSAGRNMDLPIQSQIKSKFLKPSERVLFDKWIIENYGENTLSIEVSIRRWEEYINTNAQENLFSKYLCCMYKNDEVHFYKMNEKPPQISFLCTTGESNFANKISKYFGFGLRDPYFLRADTRVVKDHLIKALEANIIPEFKEITKFTNDKNTPCLGYFDLENLPDQPTPAWDSFLYTFSTQLYRELFMAWIYSLFKADNRGRQILWIEGAGKSGKSTIVRALQKFFQKINPVLAQVMEKRWFEDKYSLAAYENCRLTVIPDCSDQRLVARDTIKNLTGSDPSSIRKMNEERKAVDLYSKVMVSANKCPIVFTNSEHELSRILYVNLDDDKIYHARDAWDPIDDGPWDIQVSAEIPAIVKKCKPFYEKHLSKDLQDFNIYPEMVAELDKNLPDLKQAVDLYWEIHWEKDPSAEYQSTTWITEDFSRFLNGLGANKITLIRRYMYVKLRSLKIVISNLGVGRTQIISGWRYLENKKTTMDAVINARMAELNNGLRQEKN